MVDFTRLFIVALYWYTSQAKTSRVFKHISVISNFGDDLNPQASRYIYKMENDKFPLYFSMKAGEIIEELESNIDNDHSGARKLHPRNRKFTEPQTDVNLSKMNNFDIWPFLKVKNSAEKSKAPSDYISDSKDFRSFEFGGFDASVPALSDYRDDYAKTYVTNLGKFKFDDGFEDFYNSFNKGFDDKSDKTIKGFAVTKENNKKDNVGSDSLSEFHTADHNVDQNRQLNRKTSEDITNKDNEKEDKEYSISDDLDDLNTAKLDRRKKLNNCFELGYHKVFRKDEFKKKHDVYGST